MKKTTKKTYCLKVTNEKNGLTTEVVKEKPICPFSISEESNEAQGQNTETEIDNQRPILVALEGFPLMYYSSVDECENDLPYYYQALCIDEPEEAPLSFAYYDDTDEDCISVKKTSYLLYLKFRITRTAIDSPVVKGVCRTFKELIELREQYGKGMFMHYKAINGSPFSQRDKALIRRSVNNQIKSK